MGIDCLQVTLMKTIRYVELIYRERLVKCNGSDVCGDVRGKDGGKDKTY